MQTAVISGGSSGIGREIALLLANKGFFVYELSRHGINHPNINHITCNVTSQEQVTSAIQTVVAKQKSIDILICNSGYGISGAIEFSETDDVENQFNVNFMGVYHLVKATLPFMRQRCQGRIIITSSLASIFPIPFQSFYAATKASVNAFAQALTNEVAEWNIEVSLVLLGDIHTPFTISRVKNQKGNDIYTNMQKAVSIMENDEINGTDPKAVAKFFCKLCTNKHISPIFVYGLKYKLLYLLNRFLPRKTVLKIIRSLYIK